MKALKEEKTFKINVLGRSYHIKSTEDAEVIEKVIGHMESKVNEVVAKLGNSPNVMVLVALNMAEECLKMRDAIQHNRQHLTNHIKRIIERIEGQLHVGNGSSL